MSKLVFGFGIIFLLVVIFHLLTRKYLNPYKLIMVFGGKGSGKSTLLVRLVHQHLKNGWTVYCTEKIPGTYHISYDDIGFVELQPNSVLFLEEIGTVWHNRQFKKFKPEVRDWFKLQRHRRVKVYMFSQTFDVDKVLRDLTDDMYLVVKFLRVFSYAKRIVKRTVLVKATAEAPSKIEENLEFDSFLFFWCGSRFLTFIPKYVKDFDSFIADDLEIKEFEYIPPLPVIKKDPLDQRIYAWLHRLDRRRRSRNISRNSNRSGGINGK